MRVTTIKAMLRYSQDTGKGSWKSLEVGAEAELAPNEDWHTAQYGLYRQLGEQMRVLWVNGKGQNSPESHPPPASTPSAPQHPEHWCTEHNTEFRKYSRDGRTWYAHRAGNQWCKERQKAVRV